MLESLRIPADFQLAMALTGLRGRGVRPATSPLIRPVAGTIVGDPLEQVARLAIQDPAHRV